MQILIFLKITVFILFSLLVETNLYAQYPSDSAKYPHLYRPRNQQDTQPVVDTLKTLPLTKAQLDSIRARQLYIQDSIQRRIEFVRDSLEARRKFVEDSLRRRRQILDSLRFLQIQLPRLLQSTLLTVSEDIVLDFSPIKIVGDSTLSDFSYKFLPFAINKPYTPWKSKVNLSTNPIPITQEKMTHRITAIQTPYLSCRFIYGRRTNLIELREKGSIVSRRSGKLYKSPIDSIFFDNRGRVVKIKRYIQFSSVTSSYQKGSPLFMHLSQIKKYAYSPQNRLIKYSLINYCDRWVVSDKVKICNSVIYILNYQGNKVLITSQRTPENNFADGTYTFELDRDNNPTSIAFKNLANSEDRRTVIELNEDGNVYRYIFYAKDQDPKTWVFKYYDDVPGAKHKVETISCTFEDDGVSYYQHNITTGKSRVRNKLTMEWGPWR